MRVYLVYFAPIAIYFAYFSATEYVWFDLIPANDSEMTYLSEN